MVRRASTRPTAGLTWRWRAGSYGAHDHIVCLTTDASYPVRCATRCHADCWVTCECIVAGGETTGVGWRPLKRAGAKGAHLRRALLGAIPPGEGASWDATHPHPPRWGAGITGAGRRPLRRAGAGDACQRRTLPGNSYEFHYTSLDMPGSATNLRDVDTVDCFNNLNLRAPHCTARPTESDCQGVEISNVSHRQGDP